MKVILNDLLSGWFTVSCMFFLYYLALIPLTFVVSLIKRILGYDENPLEKTVTHIKELFVVEENNDILQLLWVYTGLLMFLKWSGLFDKAFNMQF